MPGCRAAAEHGVEPGLWVERVPRLGTLTKAAHDNQVVAELAPAPRDIVLRKTQASAFFAAPLADILRYRAIDSLVVMGRTTSGCARAGVVDAMSLNLRTVVLRDCVGDRAQGPHEANLFDMGQKHAEVVDSEALGELLASAGATP